MAVQGRKVVKHIRDVNNFLRKQVVAGKDLSSEKDRDEVITTFLNTHTTTVGSMTPELFAFFLQKINTHALFEQLDNENYSIVFPTYVPFDVEAVAAKHGFPDLYAQLDKNLRRRSSGLAVTKTASAAVRDLGGYDHLDKVACSNSSCTDRSRFEQVKGDALNDKLAALTELKVKAKTMWWAFSNIEDFTKTSVFSANRRYTPILKELKESRIMGGRDKKASLADFNNFLDILDRIAETSK